MVRSFHSDPLNFQPMVLLVIYALQVNVSKLVLSITIACDYRALCSPQGLAMAMKVGGSGSGDLHPRINGHSQEWHGGYVPTPARMR